MSTQGLYGKYIVSKADGSPVDPEADYFVLRLDTDAAARIALRAYCAEIDGPGGFKLARELRERLDRYSQKVREGK